MHVIKLGGAVCDDEVALDALAAAYRARDEDWTIVHGGGPQLDAALASLEGPVKRVRGLRVTSPEAAQRVQATLDFVGAHLTHALCQRGLPAVHVPATERRLRAAAKDPVDGLSLGRVGTATSFDAAALPEGLCVVSPVGWDAEGPLNVNADEAALGIAQGLDADCLVLATDVPHVRGATGRDLPMLVPAEARRLIQTGTAQGGMVPKLEAAMAALRTGVPEVRIGTVGKGTRIVAA